jgi:hypothetical protein
MQQGLEDENLGQEEVVVVFPRPVDSTIYLVLL